MTKHILDRSRTVENMRLEKALTKERQVGPKRATLALQRRRRARAQTLRLSRFLRVARALQH